MSIVVLFEAMDIRQELATGITIRSFAFDRLVMAFGHVFGQGFLGLEQLRALHGSCAGQKASRFLFLDGVLLFMDFKLVDFLLVRVGKDGATRNAIFLGGIVGQLECLVPEHDLVDGFKKI